MTYIHYGDNEFNPEMLSKWPVPKETGHHYDKPQGLWASPVNAVFGWKKWCKQELYNLEKLEESFTFVISPKARVLHLHKIEDAEPYIRRDEITRDHVLDFRRIYENFDAMELHLSEDRRGFLNSENFWEWDVDSICIWNPDIVKVV